MRRRIRANAISLVQVPATSDKESEVRDAIDARKMLQDAIEDQKGKGESAEIDFARTFARGLHLAQVVDLDAAVQKNEALKALEARIQQRTEALERILELVNKHVEKLKTDFPGIVSAALTLRVETLEKALSEKEVTENGMVEELKKLKAELNKLPKGAAKKAGSGY